MNKIINILLEILLLIFSLVTSYLIVKVKVITNVFVYITSVLLLLIIFAISFIINIKRKEKKYTILKIVSYVVSVILFLSLSCVDLYLLKTFNFLNNISSIKEEVNNYYVIVLDTSRYEEISDLEKSNVGHYNNIDSKVIEHIKIDINFKDYKIDEDIVDYLYKQELDAVILSDIDKNKYEDNDEKFSYNTRIIETISIKNAIADITKNVSIKNTPFNVLISGIDTYGDINTTSRNDVNMIATINPNTNEILLTSIPRDYYVKLHDMEGYNDKLTHASYYGINTQVKTIEDLLNIDINYYVKVNFTTVEELVDNIHGIEIYSDRYLNLGGCVYKEGYNQVDGKCALRFARERHAYEGGDRHRVQNQQEVVKGVFNKLASGTTIITEYSNILNSLDGKFSTNMDINEVLNLVKFELSDINKYIFYNYQVDGYGSMGPTYSYPYQDLWIMIPYEETVTEAHNKIIELLNK